MREMDTCPNCNKELKTAKFSDLETSDRAFDVWIRYCTECGYIGDCDAD